MFNPSMMNNPLLQMMLQGMRGNANPMPMLQQMLGSNPQMAPMMQLINGKNPKQLEKICRNLYK